MTHDIATTPPQPPRLTTTCPHCGEPLDLGAWAPAASAAASPSPDSSATVTPLPTTRSSRLWQWLCPVTSPPAHAPPLPLRQRLVRVGLVLLPVLIGLLWLLFGPGISSQAGTAPTAAPTTRPAPPTVTTAVDPWDADAQAVLAVVTAYNAADPVVASTQSLDPIVPYLDPDGALYAEREAALIARHAVGDAYAVRLVGMGSAPQVEIDPSGTTATVITQETWEGTAEGQPPQTVTVRVAYTLERTDADDGWWIVAAERLPI